MPTEPYEVGDLVSREASFRVDNALTDPGDVTVKIRRPSGVIDEYEYGVDSEVGKSTVGVYFFEVPAASAGRWSYRFEGTDPAPGVAEGAWNVRSSDFDAEPAVTRWLCDVDYARAIVRELAELDDADARLDADGLMEAYVEVASAKLHSYCDREFVTWQPVDEDNEDWPREFDAHVSATWDRAGRAQLWVGDLAELTGLEIDGATVELADVVALPRIREPWRPIRSLRLATLADVAVLTVTGVWGFPQVPSEVKHACAVTVHSWWEKDQQQTTEGFDEDSTDFTGISFMRAQIQKHAIPVRARELVEEHRRGAFGGYAR